MVYCTAFNCKHDGKSSVSFFQFPNDEKYRKIWVEKIRRVDWEPTEHSRLCSAHFESHCFAQKLKLLESLGLPRPKKLILKHDAIPTIFDYEDRSSKKSATTLSRKRKSIPNPQTDKPKARRHRKIIEVIDFASLLDEYLKSLESEEKQPTRRSKGSSELVDEIIPESGLCEGGDKFVLFLNKQLPAAVRSLPLVVRFGSANVVPVTLWKDFIIRGESIPKSDIPGSVFIQLETNEGLVLGSTTFMYKEEITTGFRKIVISKNYGEQLLDAFSQKGDSTAPYGTVGTFKSDSLLKTEIPPDETHSADSSLTSILRLMLYIAAKNKATGFVQTVFKTSTGKEILSSFHDKQQPAENALELALQRELALYIEDVFNRLIVEEQTAIDEMKEKLVKRSKTREPEKVNKCGQTRKETLTKTVKRVRKNGKLSPLFKRPESSNEVPSVYSGMTSKTNSLMLLSDIALRHLKSAADVNSLEDSYSGGFSLGIPSTAVVQEKKHTAPKRNTRSFSRKVLLLPNGSTCLPQHLELCRLRKNPENCGNLQLGINMTASEILLEARELFKDLRKKRIRLAAADSSGKLDFFKSSKWTAKTLRQRIRSSSVLYVVPSK